MERSKENTGLEVGVRARTGAGHSRTGPAAGDEEGEEEVVVVVEMDEGLEPVVEVELGTRTGMPHGATSWTGRCVGPCGLISRERTTIARVVVRCGVQGPPTSNWR